MTNPANPTHKFTDAELALCKRLAAEGATIEKTAKAMGRTLTWVRDCREAAGVLPRPMLFNSIVNGVVVGPYPICFDDLRRLPPCPIDARFERRAQANTAFLISCLRAGHTYGAGEMARATT